MHLVFGRTMIVYTILLVVGLVVVPVQANIGPRPSTGHSSSPSREVSTSGCNPKKKKGCDQEDSQFDGAYPCPNP